MEAQNRGLSDTFSNLSQLLMDEYKEKSVLKQKVSTKTGNIIYQEFYPRLSKSLLDKIDDILSNYYWITVGYTNSSPSTDSIIPKSVLAQLSEKELKDLKEVKSFPDIDPYSEAAE